MDKVAGRGRGSRHGRRLRSNSENNCNNGFENTDSALLPSPSVASSSAMNRTSLSASTSNNIFAETEIPDMEGEEVVLNRRGTPIRAQKRNRTYYGEDMVNMPSVKTRAPRTKTLRPPETQVKQEPIEDEPPSRPTGTSEYGAMSVVSRPHSKSTNYKKRTSESRQKSSASAPSATDKKEKVTNRQEKPKGVGGELPRRQKVVKPGTPTGPPLFMRNQQRDHHDNPNSTLEPKLRQMPTARTKSTSSFAPPPILPPLPCMPNLFGSLEDFPLGPIFPAPPPPKQHGRFMNRAALKYQNSQNSSSFLGHHNNAPLAFHSSAPLNQASASSSFPGNDGLLQWAGLVDPGTGNTVFGDISTYDYLFQQQQPAAPGFVHSDKKHEIKSEKRTDTEGVQVIATRLKNILKLPKAHNWVCFEWFYSDIDRALFGGESDFEACLKESFPNLKTRKMTRTEWCKLRRMVGKPRRLSQLFLHEERQELYKRRQKVRVIQKRIKLPDHLSYRDLPDEIPQLITIGSKVTAKLRGPRQDGLFTGIVEGVDNSNNTYRIHFDRTEIGALSVPDFDVMSHFPPDTISTTNFTMKILRQGTCNFKFQNTERLQKLSAELPMSLFPSNALLGGFPARFLEAIVRLMKLLKTKREMNSKLGKLNVEAEKFRAYGQRYPTEFRKKYAKAVTDSDSLNNKINTFLEVIQIYCKEIPFENSSTSKLLDCEDLLSRSNKEASLIVSTYNHKVDPMGFAVPYTYSPKIVSLVQQMASLLLQVHELADEPGDRKFHEMKSLRLTMDKMKASLVGSNLQCFQNKIEIPMNRIMTGLCVQKTSSTANPNSRY